MMIYISSLCTYQNYLWSFFFLIKSNHFFSYSNVNCDFLALTLEELPASFKFILIVCFEIGFPLAVFNFMAKPLSLLLFSAANFGNLLHSFSQGLTVGLQSLESLFLFKSCLSLKTDAILLVVVL